MSGPCEESGGDGIAVATRGWRSLPGFLAKAIPSALLVFLIAQCLLGRFLFVVDAQLQQCLPGHRLYVLDRARHDVRRGDLVVFVADGQTPLEPAGRWIGKLVVGLPGDHVRVTPETVEVNGIVVGRGLLLADKVGAAASDLERDLVVPPGHVWAMGATVDSYDSRYYGPVGLWKMRGTATALF